MKSINCQVLHYIYLTYKTVMQQQSRRSSDCIIAAFTAENMLAGKTVALVTIVPPLCSCKQFMKLFGCM